MVDSHSVISVISLFLPIKSVIVTVVSDDDDVESTSSCLAAVLLFNKKTNTIASVYELPSVACL